VREIVFLGTPAELSYVVAISLIVHSGFAWLPVASLNPGSILQSYLAWTPTAPPPYFSHIIAKALAYVIVTACAGGVLGFLLGTAADVSTPDALVRLEQETTAQRDDDVNGSGA